METVFAIDFADFVKTPDPSPTSIVATTSSPTPLGGAGFFGNAVNNNGAVPFTRWYRVWERTSPKDFMQEAMIMPFILFIVLVHLWGTRKNKRKAKGWIRAHEPTLESEFSVVGFSGLPPPANIEPEKLLKEKSAQEFTTYATGRQNVAFVDIAIKLPKRYNPITYVMDLVFSFFFESWSGPTETVEAVSYSFDGKEKDLVPTPNSAPVKAPNSTYDGFIWAVVHKAHMRKFRQDRYDASMTFTRDNAKLPSWVTVMTESAEITDILLNSELIDGIQKAGDALEFLIITDQPVDKPTK